MKKLTYILLFIWNTGIGQVMVVRNGDTTYHDRSLLLMDTSTKQGTMPVKISSKPLTLGNGGKVVLSDSTDSVILNIDTTESDTALTEDLSELSGSVSTFDVPTVAKIVGDLGEGNDEGYVFCMYDSTQMRWIYRPEIDSIRNANRLKYDTVKAVILYTDTSCYNLKQPKLFQQLTAECKFDGSDLMFYDLNLHWAIGYVIIQSEFCMIQCPDGMPGCLVAHYGYGNKKEIGYLNSSKQPFSNDYIIWDYKIIE